MFRSLSLAARFEQLARPHFIVLLVTLMLVAASLTLMQFILDSGHRRAQRETVRELELTVGTLNRSIENNFSRVASLLDATGQAIARDKAFTVAPHRLHAMLAQRVRLINGVNELALFSPTGQVMARASTSAMAAMATPACLAQALSSAAGSIHIAPPVAGAYVKAAQSVAVPPHHIPLCMGVRNTQGGLQAVLVAAVDTDYFASEFDPVQQLSNARIELFSLDGLLLVGPAERRLPVDSLPQGAGLFMAEAGGPMQHSHLQGETLYSYHRTAELPLVTVASLNIQHAQRDWLADAELICVLFLALAGLSVLAGGMIFWGVQRQTRMAAEIQLLSTAISTTANSIFITDHNGCIRWVNDAFERLTGWQPHEVIGQTPRLFNSGHHDPLFFRDLWQTLMAGEVWRGQVTNQNRQGETLLVEQTITPILNKRGRLTHFVAIHEDVTKRAHAEQQARYLSRHDQLTGLPDRRFLGEALVQALESCDDVLLVFIDLDRFKAINDTQGHATGDQLLCRVSERLSGWLDGQGIVARLGGDEFALLLQGQAPNSPEQQLRELLAQMAEPYVLDERGYNLTVSMGVAIGNERQRDAATLLRQADLAMFRAKQEGKNTFCFFEADMDQRFHRHVQLDQGLREALASQDQLSLRYQPILDSHSLEPVAVEVLTRWQNAKGEWISPAEFIPVAEDSDLILALGRWQIEVLFQRVQQWQGSALDTLGLSINISAIQLARDDIAEHLLARMAAYGIAPARVHVEITETALMASRARVQSNLNVLHAAGVQLSIDDFGTGYSSLSYISDFNASILKIDRSFVVGIGHNHNDEEIIETMLALANNLDISVVAEGVDDPQQLAFLRQTGCQMVQGFLFAKPLTGTELVTFMHQPRNTGCCS